MDNIKEIAMLTVAKVDILKIKSDHYTWKALLSAEDRDNLSDTLLYINELLEKLNEY